MATQVEATASPTVQELRRDYLSDADLCALHGVALETIRRWRREGRTAPSRKIGRLHWTHIDDWRAHYRSGRAA